MNNIYAGESVTSAVVPQQSSNVSTVHTSSSYIITLALQETCSWHNQSPINFILSFILSFSGSVFLFSLIFDYLILVNHQ